ncbi:MAG: protoporphyrinogen oxidase [Proteobacteria bacterium]|nr:protoporphyrinogen oxidase [Pseudomonadota bacterium]
MDKRKFKIAILGAGISGLATAFWLNRDGFDVTILESGNEPGGSMVTRSENGFLIDYGPNSGLETTPLIRQMVGLTGLEGEMIYASETADKRYILRNNRLYALPTSPGAFLKTNLFSARAKLRLLAEPIAAKSEDGYYQSISEFVRRRLGQEFLDYAINPFVAGVFAGNPDDLSVKSAFPKLYRLEELYGGLFKGLILGARERKKRAEQSKHRAKLFSFKKGMQALPEAIAGKLGDKIEYQCKVEKIVPSETKFKVLYRRNDNLKQRDADVVLSTIPAYNAASIFDDPQLISHLNNIYYPPVKVLYLGFRKADVGQPLDGFGFLIPEKERKAFLGAIWSSTIFPYRAYDDRAAFTLFIGGARSPELLDHEDDGLIRHVIKEFKEIMKIDKAPIFATDRLWPKAIPQYGLGYIEHERYFERFESDNPGLFLSGNFRGGISVGDCFKNSEITYKNICKYVDHSSKT